MIRTFRHKGLQNFFERENKAGITATHFIRLKDILASLDSAVEVSDIDAPGLGLHPLKGKLKGYWAVSVSGAWRILFRFEDGDVFDVDYQQYHQLAGFMAMHDPPHPGGIIRRQYMDPLGLGVTATAKALGVSRKQLSQLLNERAGISPEMAIRLGLAFSTTPEFWINLQRNRELWIAKKSFTTPIPRLYKKKVSGS